MNIPTKIIFFEVIVIAFVLWFFTFVHPYIGSYFLVGG